MMPHTKLVSRRRLSGWRLAESAALLATIPAFYLALLSSSRVIASGLYLVALLASGSSSGIEASMKTGESPPRHRLARLQIALPLVAGLLLSALLPAGDEMGVLVIRLATALLVVLRLGESIRPWFWRNELPKFLTLAVLVLVLCGVGFWWLEPRAQTFGDGFWLAFTTAATVGYGDIVPSTAASKIFAVFVVLMGAAVFSLMTAAIAATWVQAEKRRIEKEILKDVHRQLQAMRSEMEAMRRDLVGFRRPT